MVYGLVLRMVILNSCQHPFTIRKYKLVLKGQNTAVCYSSG